MELSTLTTSPFIASVDDAPQRVQHALNIFLLVSYYKPMFVDAYYESH
jgi:hypothetical protein